MEHPTGVQVLIGFRGGLAVSIEEVSKTRLPGRPVSRVVASAVFRLMPLKLDNAIHRLRYLRHQQWNEG
jgi:hypothetical protein